MLEQVTAIAVRLKELREISGLSVEELAAQLHLELEKYQEYETICEYYYKNQCDNKNYFELQKDVFLESCIFPQIEKDWKKLIFRSTSC